MVMKSKTKKKLPPGCKLIFGKVICGKGGKKK